ncbi:heavy-metal-associated domain-containing protein [Sunxiuqinia indica]|uniref:heavy-metal-associated domain-containing protein n=1 Tax=Sunxiuqinia indica TaxID=2692584 RepID=UPI00135A2874|nr:cation transporter [Sunxiuqinia indica]
MKTKVVLSLIVVAMLSVTTAFGKDKTEKFKVYGNCGMCENRIEKAAKSVDGVSTADWDKESKMMQVKFDDSKTDVHKVEMAIAKAGHDTQMHKATDEAYNKLPGCCQYERAGDKKSNSHNGHSH